MNSSVEDRMEGSNISSFDVVRFLWGALLSTWSPCRGCGDRIDLSIACFLCGDCGGIEIVVPALFAVVFLGAIGRFSGLDQVD